MLILIFQMLVNFSIVFCPLINNSSSLSAFDISVLTFVEYALLKLKKDLSISAHHVHKEVAEIQNQHHCKQIPL